MYRKCIILHNFKNLDEQELNNQLLSEVNKNKTIFFFCLYAFKHYKLFFLKDKKRLKKCKD